jgi:hypothetical protein
MLHDIRSYRALCHFMFRTYTIFLIETNIFALEVVPRYTTYRSK